MAPTLRLIATLEGHTDRVWGCAWNPTGTLLATCGGDKCIRVFSSQGNKWTCIATLEEAQTRTIRACEWSPCGNFIASASFDGTVAIWEKQGGDFSHIATLEGHENEVKSVSWKPDGSLLASSSRDKSIWLWEGDPENDFECVSVLHGHQQDVKNVTWHPTRDLLFSAGYDDTVRVWRDDGDDWVLEETLTGHTSTVWAVAVDAKGHRLVSGSDDKSLAIWKEFPSLQPKWKRVCTLQDAHSRTIFSVDWGHNNDLIASCGADNAIKIFAEDPESHRDTPNFINIVSLADAHLGDVNCVRWKPKTSATLASVGDDTLVKIWVVEGYDS